MQVEFAHPFVQWLFVMRQKFHRCSQVPAMLVSHTLFDSSAKWEGVERKSGTHARLFVGGGDHPTDDGRLLVATGPVNYSTLLVA
jgi:hypothetical protein